MGILMRIFSYLFHAILAMFLFGVSAFALLNGKHNLHLSLLPWEGKNLTFWMLFLGLAGLMSVLLAVFGKSRILFLIWSIGVLLMLVRGYVFTGYYFGGLGGLSSALAFMLAAFLAAIGAWLRFRQREPRWLV